MYRQCHFFFFLARSHITDINYAILNFKIIDVLGLELLRREIFF